MYTVESFAREAADIARKAEALPRRRSTPEEMKKFLETRPLSVWEERDLYKSKAERLLAVIKRYIADHPQAKAPQRTKPAPGYIPLRLK